MVQPGAEKVEKDHLLDGLQGSVALGLSARPLDVNVCKLTVGLGLGRILAL